MAKGRSSRSRRDALGIANGTLPDLSDLVPRQISRSEDLLDAEDLRRSTPVVSPLPSRDLLGRVLKVVTADVARPSRSGRVSPDRLVFKALPEEVAVCVRRHRRREVLFAKKKAGRGGMKRPRFNFLSSISCRRK